MSVIVVAGLQWGDEGKGKMVDLLGEFASATVRFQGGNNAGHTVVADGRRVVLNLLPSGALRPHVRCILGQGMVIDPGVLLDEMRGVEEIIGKFDPERLVVSRRAHVILPVHRQADSLAERATTAGDNGPKIGTTQRGIGQAYQDKAGRRGLRLLDLLLPSEEIARRIEQVHLAWSPSFERAGAKPPDVAETVEMCMEWGRRLAPFMADASWILCEEVSRGSNVLLEGAQGTLLDIDHGTYPFVTSSNSCALGACAGAGIPPTSIDGVLGITKAYTTRVGGGPFPTEIEGPVGDQIRKAGNEFGSTTGRPRRCGWLDIPALRYAVRLNGVSTLGITKLDVLGGMSELQVCTAYRLGGELLTEIPLDRIDGAEPVYERIPCWTGDISGVRSVEELPSKAQRYLAMMEGWLGIKAHLVSVGPARNETIVRHNPFR